MITVVTWLWGDKYNVFDVKRLRQALETHLLQPHNFICVSDRHVGPYTQSLIDTHLTRMPGCLARLRLFDPCFQHLIGATERIVNIDLDVVVTGQLDPLFDRNEDFVILQGANAANPCPYNGSIFMLRHKKHQEVWSDFNLDRVKQIPYYEYPDDQGWFHHMIPNAAGWTVGSPSGIYAFQKPGWPKGSDDLPRDARLVVFPGWRSPDKFRHLPWISNRMT